MPDSIDNKDGKSNIDNNIAALDNISLEDVQTLEITNTINTSTTGGDNQTAEELAAIAAKKKKEDDDAAQALIDAQNSNNQNNTNNNDDNTDVNLINSFEDLINVVKNKATADLTDEDSTELLSIVDAFGGQSFNTDGEIVDAEGKVLYTAEQVKHYLTNNELPVDENGNFVDASGNVIKDKNELFRENTTVGVVMNALAKNFDIAFKDDFLPEDTESGIVDLVVKVAKVLNSSSVENYMKANPELEAFRKHLQLHGTADGYKTSTVDYDKLDYKTLTKEAKQAIIKEAFTSTGQQLTPNYLKYLDTLSEEDYNTEVSANATVLKEQQKQKKELVDKQLKEREETQQKEAEQYWNTVTNTIKNGKLPNINIPVAERDAFLSYVLTPVANGKSKDMLDAEKEDINSDLLMSYLRYKGNDISALARNIAQTQQVQGLRERMAKNNTRNNSSDKGKKPTTQNDYIPSLGEINL